ncbi:hypothetical protein EVA_20986 [gut metagenome]|uniref:Uncharacterized protein n=1 Tax=gut metagenome TaxID=749906 RepID=J9FMS5_9ZZZZ
MQHTPSSTPYFPVGQASLLVFVANVRIFLPCPSYKSVNVDNCSGESRIFF